MAGEVPDSTDARCHLSEGERVYPDRLARENSAGQHLDMLAIGMSGIGCHLVGIFSSMDQGSWSLGR